MALFPASISFRSVALVAALLSPGSSLFGQALPGPVPTPMSLERWLQKDPEATYQDRLELKLIEGCGAEWRSGRLLSRTGTDLSGVAALLVDATVEPLVTSVSWDQLDQWHRRACAVLPAHNRPGHLGLWFRVRVANAAACQWLRAQLAEHALVEHVYLEPRFYPATAARGSASLALPKGGDIPPTTPAYMSQQLSHGLSPDGHGVRAVTGILGARGQGVGLRMLEDSWYLDHEDVCQLVAANFLSAVPAIDPVRANHGLSGSSIMFGDRNLYGVTGLVDEVEVKFVGLGPSGGFGNAIAVALANSQPGDVAVVVLMILVPSLGPGTWLPIEFIQSVFDATLTATANELHVVVPAGNGNRSLDDPALLSRFDRNFRDSGAIIVGASNAALLERTDFSNWGTRIDAHSWGEDVVSAGWGTLFFPNNDPQQSYTADGTGTSSSTALMGGLVAMIQGAARRQLGQTLTNAQILGLLHTIGPTTPDVIGRRPDLVAILQSLGVLDGLSVDQPDVMLNDTITVTMAGAPGDVVGLFGSFATGDVPLGFNRNVHLDLSTLTSLGAFFMPTGTAQYQLPVPNNVSLHQADIYFQAVRLTGAQPLFVTNSCQVTIL